MAKIPRMSVENQITTLSVLKIAIKFSPCKKVQSSIEKFHWSKKLWKIGSFSFNLNIPLKNVNLFLHVFLCLKLILRMKHYMKLLTIFIWKFAIFLSWQLALLNLGQLAPASFLYLQQAHGHHVWGIYIVD